MTEHSQPASPRPDELLGSLPLGRLAVLVEAVEAAAGSPSHERQTAAAFARALDLSEPPRPVDRWLYGLFKLLVDPGRSRAFWDALQSRLEGGDRERIVLELWRILERHHGARIEEKVGSTSYHRLWLFEWFFERYDLRRARRVLGAGAGLSGVHYFLALGLCAVLCLRREGLLASHELLAPHATLYSVLAVGLVYAAAVAAQAYRFRAGLDRGTNALIAAVNSLVPRLAGASAVGLVALASSAELLERVAEAGPLWLALLPLAGYGYLLLEMGRRVHPLPRLRRLLGNGLDVLTTAFAHGTALVLITEGGLTKVIGSGVPFTWGQSLSVLVFIVTIGLIVNLIWAEQPVTEPL